jgi:predicted O-methyltransferase YrrM
MTTLDSPLVRDVLDRLYDDANKADDTLLPQVRAEAARLGLSPGDSRLVTLLDDAFIAVAPEVGRLLYSFVRALRPATVVEFGTSFGLSTIHIASALRDNGYGRLVATEIQPVKAMRATDHVRQAGLDDLVDIRIGDAFATLAETKDIDFLLLDGWKDLYLPMLKMLEPAINPGGMIVADDIDLCPDMLRSYTAYVRNPVNGYTSSKLPIDDGLELSIRH